MGAVALAPPGGGCAGAGDLLPGAVLGAGEPGQGPSLVTQTRTETLPGDVRGIWQSEMMCCGQV